MKSRTISSEITFAASHYGKEKEYWLDKLAGEPVKSCFPRDFKPVKDGEYESKTSVFTLPGKLVSRLTEISGGMDHRLYMVLLAGLSILLKKYTCSDDILVGSPIYKQDTEGDFINTALVLRNRIADTETFKNVLLKEVRKTVSEAGENQNYPLDTLLYHLNIPAAGDQCPLFDVALLLENLHDREYLRRFKPNVIFTFLRTGGGVEGRVEYNASLYRPETVERIVAHFTAVLEKALFQIDIPVGELDILTVEEKRQQLVTFNDTAVPYPGDRTIDREFEAQVRRTPDNIAVAYGDRCITYRALDERAEALAAYLRARGIKPEEPAAVMAEPSIEMIAAVLGILKAGGAYLPINPDYPGKRKEYLLKDGNVRFLLTNYPDVRLPVREVIALDNPAIYRGRGGGEKHGSPLHLAYIIYTSGSTGTPRGVMVQHRNVLRLVKNTAYFRFNKGERLLQTGALEFDASTFEIWGSLLNGLQLHLVPREILLDTNRLKETIRKSRINIMWMTSALFNQMVDTGIEMFDGPTHLLVGGDVLSPSHIRRVRQRFPRLTVINGYGPTENTTFSLTHTIDKDYRDNIPIGKPISNSTAYIVDRFHRLQPVGVPGELIVGGDGVSRGYLNRPELTAERFNRSYKSYKTYISYKTGDLARWRFDGTVEFLGRLDHQVKIRGYRIEPGEIENRLLNIPFLERAVVLHRDDGNGEKYLCAYVVADRQVDGVELKELLAKDLPDYMIPSQFVFLDTVPLTSNGKVDAKRLPPPRIDPRAAYVAPRNELERKLVETWSEVLKIDKETIGIDADFFESGGHSLKAAALVNNIHKTLNTKIPLAEIFKAPTVRELAQYIEGKREDKFEALASAPEKDHYPLSSAQKRLYIMNRMEPGSTGYNVPAVVILEGELDVEKLETTFRRLIQRHESLRTSFETVDEKPVQRIHETVDFGITRCRVPAPGTRESEKEIIRDFITPFNLDRAPLMRVGLIESGTGRHVLMVDMHHIITDGSSLEILLKEFMALYCGEELPDVRFQYKDYSEWQNRMRLSGEIQRQEQYWLRQFPGDIPRLQLPTDWERPEIQQFEGRTAGFDIGEEDTAALKSLASGTGTTLYIVLLALYNVFLSKLSGEEDILVGTPTAGRRHADLENVIGMFVNSLCLRNSPGGEKPFMRFLEEVGERTLEAFENQDYQFEDLVDKLGLSRDAGRNPLFDVTFSFHNELETGMVPEIHMPGLKLIPYEHEAETSKFDLTLNAVESEGKLFFAFFYSSRLFEEETVERFIDYFKEIVRNVIRDPLREIAEIEAMSGAQQEVVLSHAFADLESEGI